MNALDTAKLSNEPPAQDTGALAPSSVARKTAVFGAALLALSAGCTPKGYDSGDTAWAGEESGSDDVRKVQFQYVEHEPAWGFEYEDLKTSRGNGAELVTTLDGVRLENLRLWDGGQCPTYRCEISDKLTVTVFNVPADTLLHIGPYAVAPDSYANGGATWTAHGIDALTIVDDLTVTVNDDMPRVSGIINVENEAWFNFTIPESGENDGTYKPVGHY